MNPDNTISITALILAGGKSSRMGQDKALILWDGTPILERVCQVAAECCQQVYILTPWPDRYQAIVNKKYKFLQESRPGQGPLVGLTEGLAEITADWILLLACDLPLLEPEILQNWVSQLSHLPIDILAVVPRRAELWEPLCAFYRREALPNLYKFIQKGERSFQAWLQEIPVQAIPVGEKEARMLWNCNTPTDLQQVVDLY